MGLGSKGGRGGEGEVERVSDGGDPREGVGGG